MDQMPDSARQALRYDGKISQLFGIFLLNLLLTLITLGIFRFWAITRVRRYLWSHMRFEDTRFTYTGKGKELFLGFLLAMVILGLIFSGLAMVVAALAKSHPVLAAIPVIIAYLGVFVLWGAAHFSAQRYRLSRTEWRGIRGGMEGSALRYGVNWLLYVLLVIVTLYQAVPWMQVGLARWRINASRFGSAVFHCDARARRLYLVWLATLIGYVVLLGLIVAVVITAEWPVLRRVFAEGVSSPAFGAAIKAAVPLIIGGIVVFLIGAGLLATWYYASMLRGVVGNTSAAIPGSRGDAIRFHSTVSAGGLLWLLVSNFLIVLFTLGLGLPIVLHRYAKYIARTTLMSGTFDAAALAQSTQSRPTLGEGFLQALDPGIV